MAAEIKLEYNIIVACRRDVVHCVTRTLRIKAMNNTDRTKSQLVSEKPLFLFRQYLDNSIHTELMKSLNQQDRSTFYRELMEPIEQLEINESLQQSVL